MIPEHTGWHPGLEGPFMLAEFDERTPVVQLENRRSALFLHQPEDVAAYVEAVTIIGEVALSPQESSAVIEEALQTLEATS